MGREKKNIMRGDENKWIKNAINPDNKGALHKILHIAEDKKIPQPKLNKATHSRNPSTKKMAVLAETLRGFNKK